MINLSIENNTMVFVIIKPLIINKFNNLSYLSYSKDIICSINSLHVYNRKNSG